MVLLRRAWGLMNPRLHAVPVLPRVCVRRFLKMIEHCFTGVPCSRAMSAAARLLKPRRPTGNAVRAQTFRRHGLRSTSDANQSSRPSRGKLPPARNSQSRASAHSTIMTARKRCQGATQVPRFWGSSAALVDKVLRCRNGQLNFLRILARNMPCMRTSRSSSCTLSVGNKSTLSAGSTVT